MNNVTQLKQYRFIVNDREFVTEKAEIGYADVIGAVTEILKANGVSHENIIRYGVPKDVVVIVHTKPNEKRLVGMVEMSYLNYDGAQEFLSGDIVHADPQSARKFTVELRNQFWHKAKLTKRSGTVPWLIQRDRRLTETLAWRFSRAYFFDSVLILVIFFGLWSFFFLLLTNFLGD